MEPNRNPRVDRAQKRTFYNITRRYGALIVIRRADTSSTDYITGDRVRNYTQATIRNAVYVPPITSRTVTYTAAMMQAMRQFAWQGGAGQDVESSHFLICERDIKGWGEVDSTQEVQWLGVWYKVSDVQQFDGGLVVTVKSARGSQE